MTKAKTKDPDFVPTHRARADKPPEAAISLYDPAIGHIAVAPADAVEKLVDGRDGTLLQGSEKTPVPVYKGNAIIDYGSYIYAAMPAADVKAWFEPIVDSKLPALPERGETGKSASEALKETE